MEGTYGHRRIPLRRSVVQAERDGRMSVPGSGGARGFVGGLVALAVVHALEPDVVLRAVFSAAAAREVEVLVALAIAYGTAASLGALAGGAFALVTRRTRRWGARQIWAFGLFVTPVTMLVSIFQTSRDTPDDGLALALVLSAAAFGLIASLELPRRRSR
jgi:FtsH-binding integral membrane protein